MFLSQMVQLPAAWSCMYLSDYHHSVPHSQYKSTQTRSVKFSVFRVCCLRSRFASPHAMTTSMRPHLASYNCTLKYHPDFILQPHAVANLPRLPLFLSETSVSCSRREPSLQKRSSKWCSILESCRCWLRALLWGSLRICLEVARYHILHWSLFVRWNTDRR